MKESSSTSCDATTACNNKIKVFREKLETKSEEKDYFIVSLSLASILHFDLTSSSPVTKQVKVLHLKNYLEALHVPDARLSSVWNLIGFQANPDKDPDPADSSDSMCEHCEHHMEHRGTCGSI